MGLYDGRWKCPKCGSWWPTYTNVDAHHNYKRARQAHPDQKCEKFKESKCSANDVDNDTK